MVCRAGSKFAMLELRVLLCVLVWHFEIQKLPDALIDFGANDFLTIEPRNALVKLKPIERTP